MVRNGEFRVAVEWHRNLCTFYWPARGEKNGAELRVVCWANSMSESVLWPLWALEWPFWSIWGYGDIRMYIRGTRGTCTPICTLWTCPTSTSPRREEESRSRGDEGPWIQMSLVQMSVVLNTKHPLVVSICSSASSDLWQSSSFKASS